MNIKNILTGVVATALLASPVVSLANTYQFVDTSGNLQSMEASSPTVALNTAYQLGIHSGVVLVREGNPILPTLTPAPAPVSTNTTGSGNYYQFVNTSGNLQGLWATNASIALATAHPLAIHSGVMLATNTQ